jgi:hypothetical protein
LLILSIRISLELGKIFYRRSMRQDSCNFIPISTSSFWRWRKQRNLGLKVGGVLAPEKERPLIEVRGMARAVPDRRRQSLGLGDEARGRTPAASRVDDGLAGGGCRGSMGGAAVVGGQKEKVTSVY